MSRISKVDLHGAISDIMKQSNLDKLTTKKIRLLLEKKFHTDLASRKDDIDKIVMQFVCKKSGTYRPEDFEESSDDSSNESSGGSSCSSGSGSGSCSDSDCSGSTDEESANSSDGESVQKNKVKASQGKGTPVKGSSKKSSVKAAPKTPPKKLSLQAPLKKASPVLPPKKRISSKAAANFSPKRKMDLKQTAVDDAEYARQLQAEEWNFRRRTVNKLFRDVPQLKSDKKVQGKKKATPFTKKCNLSPLLAELVGTNQMSRPDVVQKVCAIVKERNLLDPSNKQYAICDEQLLKLFGKKRIRMFGLIKDLKKHIKDIK